MIYAQKDIKNVFWWTRIMTHSYHFVCQVPFYTQMITITL